MKIVNQNNANHNIKLIPRFYPSGTVILTLKNESNQEQTIVNNTYNILDGYLILNFDFDFVNKDRFQFSIKKNDNIVFRGKLYATAEDTQNYKQSIDIYRYEF